MVGLISCSHYLTFIYLTFYLTYYLTYYLTSYLTFIYLFNFYYLTFVNWLVFLSFSDFEKIHKPNAETCKTDYSCHVYYSIISLLFLIDCKANPEFKLILKLLKIVNKKERKKLLH